MQYLVVLLLAVAVSANVREAIRNQRQAIIVNPGQFGVQIQRPQLQQLQRVQLVAQPVLVQQPIQTLQQPAFQTIQAIPQPAFQTFQPRQQQPLWRILKQTQEVDASGPYRWSYETENGIRAAEEGVLIRASNGEPAVAKQGNFAYTAPDGTPIALSYVADENGFRAVGDHLPTPPPIPAEILASLEQNAREEAQGSFRK